MIPTNLDSGLTNIMQDEKVRKDYLESQYTRLDKGISKTRKSNTNTKRKKRIVIAVVLCLWVFMVVTDFARVCKMNEKPIFCIATETADDGGSGTYLGLGYSFEIKGNFMPEDENPGVKEYYGKLFGVFGFARKVD